MPSCSPGKCPAIFDYFCPVSSYFHILYIGFSADLLVRLAGQLGRPDYYARRLTVWSLVTHSVEQFQILKLLGIGKVLTDNFHISTSGIKK